MTAPDIVHNSEEFVFGGWTTQLPYKPSPNDVTDINQQTLNEIIPNLGSSLVYSGIGHNQYQQQIPRGAVAAKETESNFRSKFSTKGALDSILASGCRNEHYQPDDE